MKHIEAIYVDSDKNIKCDGDAGASNHPAVYLNMGKQKKVTCDYCGKTCILKEENK